jgi:malate synthase
MQESINKTQHQDHSLINDSKITGPHIEGQDDILTKEALNFVCHLEKEFGGRISEMLSKREERQSALNETATLSFPKETEDTVRQSEWSVKPAPHDLQDRRVEITGPVERKMIINALNSGANAFMADFEDSNTPTWDNQINGQINLRDANLGTIYFKNDKGKEYKLRENPAVLIVRPRGLHMQEKHMLFNDKPVAASLFDFGLYLFHNAHTLISKNSGPYFYIPKLEHYLEARLWNDIFCFAEDYLDLERSTVRATAGGIIFLALLKSLQNILIMFSRTEMMLE